MAMTEVAASSINVLIQPKQLRNSQHMRIKLSTNCFIQMQNRQLIAQHLINLTIFPFFKCFVQKANHIQTNDMHLKRQRGPIWSPDRYSSVGFLVKAYWRCHVKPNQYVS